MIEFDRSFGVELEFTKKSTREFLSEIISKSFPLDEVKITQWQKNVDNKEWICKPDSSCGFEIASPVLNTREDLFKIEKLIDSLKSNGATVSLKCGIHIHINCKDYTVNQMAKLISYWIKCEPIIFCMFPKYRRTSKYCQPLFINPVLRQNLKPKELIFINCQRKNKSLNIRGYKRRGTIEFRLLEGSLRSYDILNWIVFCIYFFKNAEKNITPQDLSLVDFDSFWTFMQLDKENPDELVENMKYWIIKRIKKFSPISAFKTQAEKHII